MVLHRPRQAPTIKGPTSYHVRDLFVKHGLKGIKKGLCTNKLRRRYEQNLIFRLFLNLVQKLCIRLLYVRKALGQISPR